MAGEEYPIGDLLFDCGGVRIGFEICRDAWVADRTGARLAQRGADMLLNPSASHFAFAKQQIRERFVLEGSRAFCVSYAYCNLLGNEAGRAIYDGGTLIASGGKMLAPRPAVLVCRLAADDGRRRRDRHAPATGRDRFPIFATLQATTPCDRGGFQYPDVAEPDGSVVRRAAASRTRSDRRVRSASCRAQCPAIPRGKRARTRRKKNSPAPSPLALFDYLRKSQLAGFVVSLSGGADSSAVAVLVHLMVQFGGRELGLAGMHASCRKPAGCGRPRTIPSNGDRLSEASSGELLTCVYQSTRNSGADDLGSRSHASPSAVGAEFLEWNVDAHGRRLRRDRFAGDRPRS